MRRQPEPLTARSEAGVSVPGMKRLLITIIAAAALLLVGAALAFGGGRGTIWDDGHAAKPGSLDDGKDLLPQAKIGLARAVEAAQQAAQGQLGQVDLERLDGRVVYSVDVGDREVRIDAADGTVASIQPRD
jgi:uncharacterized membrane protein YkoI